MLTNKWFALSLCVLAALAVPVQAAEPLPAISEQVKITEVQVRLSDHGTVVLLIAEGKAIPIFVDLTVALSIQGALNGEKTPRPLSHDLMHTMMETFGAHGTQTFISFQDCTFYGDKVDTD